MNAIRLNVDDISLELISDEHFDLKQSVIEAKHYIQNLPYDRTLQDRINLLFESDIWILPNEEYGTTSFSFNELRSDFKFYNHLNTDELILRVKCWLTSQLQRVSINRAQTLLKCLIFVIKKTDYFDVNQCEEFAEFLRTNSEISNTKKLTYIQVTLNFLEYNMYLSAYDIYDNGLLTLSK